MKERGNLNIQSYVDARKVASVAWLLHTKGYETRGSYSSLVKAIIDAVLSTEGKKPIETTQEALEILSALGFSLQQLQSAKRGRGLRASLQEEDKQEEQPGGDKEWRFTLAQPLVPEEPEQEETTVSKERKAQIAALFPGSPGA